ncbi:MAG: hypothetical protein WC777_03420 [Candidatus Gracilibacteria bacterium]
METLKLITSTEFIEKWQTLIGSALGPFLAIILSVIGFLVKGCLQKRSNRKEAIRRTEIAFSQTLSHLLVAVSQLEDFIARAKTIVEQVQVVTDPNFYAIQETNFPATIAIYFDEDLIKMRLKSYYVHNKILITDYLVRSANGNIKQFRYDFERLLDRNERMATPERMRPPAQRTAFVENFGGFITMIETFVNSLKIENALSIAEAKVYNLKLMKNRLWTVWKYEGTTLKYFRDKKVMERYNGSMDAVDRINDLMKKEAEKLMQEAQNRIAQGDVEGGVLGSGIHPLIPSALAQNRKQNQSLLKKNSFSRN